MAPGLPDRVDCARLAEDAAVLERVYPLGEMPRLQDLLADVHGSVRATFAFERLGVGAPGASVAVEAVPQLICQRCLRGFAFAASGCSEVEFSSDAGWGAAQSQREVYAMEDGLISLRELAEEELLLALPIVAVCGPQHGCGHASIAAAGGAHSAPVGEGSLPFAGLQDLLKKT